MPSLSHILSKTKKSLSGQQRSEIWKPGGLHICKSGLRTLLPSRTCWHGSSSEQSAPHTGPSQPYRDEVCLQRVRQRPGVLSWHRQFIAIHHHTHRILHAQGDQGLTHPGGQTLLTRMAAKNQSLLACGPHFFEYRQSPTSSSSAHSSPC